jgi:SAM-dependent methyltransferase
VSAQERWAVDAVPFPELYSDPGVTVVQADLVDVELPDSHFDAVLLSNALEHLASQEVVGAVLQRLRRAIRPGGRIAVLGPNFRYCMREYFDCADHTLALTHLSISEHLYAAGFELRSVTPRFLPYSFRGRLPAWPSLVRGYLRLPFLWHVLGKQFLVIAEVEEHSEP